MHRGVGEGQGRVGVGGVKEGWVVGGKQCAEVANQQWLYCGHSCLFYYRFGLHHLFFLLFFFRNFFLVFFFFFSFFFFFFLCACVCVCVCVCVRACVRVFFVFVLSPPPLPPNNLRRLII